MVQEKPRVSTSTDRLKRRETGKFRSSGFDPDHFEARPDPNHGLGSTATQVWRISLEPLNSPGKGFGLDLNGDVIFGRVSDSRDQIDLTPFGAVDQGVSRQHAVLRPSPTTLYLIDLNSTNGTYVGGKHIGKNTPHALTNGDIFSLGHLEFVLQVIARPQGLIEVLNQEIDLASALTGMAKAITSQLATSEVLNQALDLAMSMTNAGETSIWLIDEQSGELFMEAQRGIDNASILEMRLSMEASLAGEVIATGKSVRASRDPDDDKIKVKTGYLVESIMYVPMIVGGIPIGVLSAANQEPGKTFSERDETVITALADFAAIAIQNARAYEATDLALQQRVQELTSLNELATIVSATLKLEEVYKVLREQLLKQWEVDGAEVWLISSKYNGFARLSAVASQTDTKPLTAWYPFGQGIVGRVAQQGKSLVLNDAASQQSFDPEIDRIEGVETRSIAAIPLEAEKNVIGVLALFNKRGADFDRRDVERLKAFAFPVATAIRNANLFAESERERATIRALATTLSQPILMVDDWGDITIANEAAQAIIDMHMEALFNGVRDLVGRTGELVLGEKTFITSVQYLKNLGTMIVMQDITYVKQLENTRTEFVYALSHDLKSPIASIRGYSNLLQSMLPLDEQSQKFIKNIINATDRIMDMISQLLDIAQMNENPEQYRVKFDMSEAVQRAITDVEGNALDRRMEIVFEVIGSPYVVLGDERRLYRCALNLLDNALKYAPPDSQIFVTLSYSDKGLTMMVRDQGDGISEADIPHVFERFFRSKQHTTRLGIGLGLEFVAATARAHGGDIKVENHPEGGAVFIFTLPPGVRTASPTPTSA